MIKQIIYLEEYDWIIKMYYAVDDYYEKEILYELENIKCSQDIMNDVKDLLDSNTFNTGFTYSNLEQHTTISVIGLTTSPMQFQNTIDHEKGHIASHIGRQFNLDPYGEQIQYLLGLIGQRMYPIASKFLCPHCKKELQLDLFSQYDIK